MGQKIDILGHRLGLPRADFLCLLPEQYIRNTLRCLGLVLFDDVAVKIFRGVHAGMAQLLRYRYNVRTVCQKDRGHSVAESVGIDMGQIVAAGKVMEPTGDTVRVHIASIVRGEDKAGMPPPVAVGDLEPELFPLVEPQEVHGFNGEIQIADIAGFGIAQIGAFAFGGNKGLINLHTVVFKIHLLPLQAHNLTTAAAGDDHKVGNQLPL